MSAPVPRLTWGARPKGRSCANPECGRMPLCGFADAEGSVFYCAVCYEDNPPVYPGAPRTAEPRFRDFMVNPGGEPYIVPRERKR